MAQQNQPVINNSVAVSAKQAVVTPQDLQAAGATSAKRLRIAGLTGWYGKAVFGDDHITTTPVEPDLADALRKHYGHENVVEVEVEVEQPAQ